MINWIDLLTKKHIFFDENYFKLVNLLIFINFFYKKFSTLTWYKEKKGLGDLVSVEKREYYQQILCPFQLSYSEQMLEKQATYHCGAHPHPGVFTLLARAGARGGEILGRLLSLYGISNLFTVSNPRRR